MTLPTPSFPQQISPPEFAISELGPQAIVGAEVLALPVLPREGGGVLLGPGGAEVAEQLGVDLSALLELDSSGAGPAEAGAVTSLPVPLGGPDNAELRWVLLVGVGAQRPEDFRRAGAALARATTDRTSVATSLASIATDEGLEGLVVAMMLASFVFHGRSGPPEHVPVTRVVLAGLPPSAREPVTRAVAIGGAAWRARMLATVPSNLKNPPWLAQQARELCAAAGLTLRVWDEKQLAAGGFGGILGVGRASDTPPRLIRMDYTPARSRRSSPTVVLVGKGITFDSGGLSIKTAESMVTMKRDMTGGAVVMATMAALSAVGCPVKVVGLVAAAENSVSGDATRPGDVLRHYGGRTTEVTNTDAEGRLVLADALAYAAAELDPAVVVDIATLTGAVKVALGQRTGGLFANDDVLAASLSEAGRAAGEPWWRLPLAEAYEDKLSSKIADADNAPGGPGAITAALFLQHFVSGLPWAHLDMASSGDSPAEHDEWTTGPTGFGVRTLLRWLGGPDPLAGITRTS